MVGPLGPEAIAAVGLGSGIFTAIAVFGMGLLLGLDTLVSQAFGAKQLDECRAWLRQGLGLAVLASPLILALSAVATWSLDRWGLNPAILALTRPYLAVVTVSTVPLLLYAALRRYLLGIHHTRPIMFALVSANAINAGANYVFVYGLAGIPAMGVTGSAVATTIARVYMAIVLWLAVRQVHRANPITATRPPQWLELSRLATLARLGLPAALQVTLEVGAFTFATALAARLDAVSSAAHQIAMNIASVAYMVPLGLCSAAAVRVGHAVGARDLPRAVRAGWTAIGLSTVVMAGVGVMLWLMPTILLGPFTRDPGVVALGARLLLLAAAFQIFDAVQTVAIGALRGIGDTFAPMLIGLVGHWLVGLPVGYVLCFVFARGVLGLWVGFLAGLVVVATILIAVWRIRSLRLLTVSVPFAPSPSAP
jgi:MATE family multidrug resistance protein